MDLRKYTIPYIVAKVKELSENAGAVWGNITGNIANQTDLQNALSSKQDTLQSGTNIKTINNQSFLGSGNINIEAEVTASSIATAINGANTKNSLADTDTFPLTESSTLKKILWSTIRNILKNYFDGLYLKIGETFSDGLIVVPNDNAIDQSKFVDKDNVVILSVDTVNRRIGIRTIAPNKQIEINSENGDCLRLTYNDDDGEADNYVDFLVSSDGTLIINASSGIINTANDIEITDATKGIILKSPNETRFRVTVGNDGALITTAI